MEEHIAAALFPFQGKYLWKDRTIFINFVEVDFSDVFDVDRVQL